MISENGLQTLQRALEKNRINFFPLIMETGLWVSPETFKMLPIWYPEFWRKSEMFKANWVDRQLNKGAPKLEANVKAATALTSALGLSNDYEEWTCCHIWGTHGFEIPNMIVRDPKFYSCVANMVYLPTPLKAFTDSMPEVKYALRVLAYNLYGWTCEHEQASVDATLIRCGEVPDNYPKDYPRPDGKTLPKNISHLTDKVKASIMKRRAHIKEDLSNTAFTQYPRKEVQDALDHWNIKL